MNLPSLSPLKGIKVLDLSRLLPGPYATQLLADMGAEVIKVETPLLGDYARHAPPEFGGETMFKLINRGKQSLALNYRNKKGKKIFYRLAEEADVIVETSKPGSVDRWGIGYKDIFARNPGIVYCSLSGYGQDGPLRDRVGHDINYIALGGLLDATGPAGGTPVLPGVQVADLAGASMAVMGILAALFQRQGSGKGQFLDIAMLDAVVHWVAPTVGAIGLYGQDPRRGEIPLSGGAPCNNIYETSDGEFLTLGAIETPFWKTFCLSAGRPDLIPHAFDTTFVQATRELFLQAPRQDWLDKFQGTDVPIEPVLSLGESHRHPQVRFRSLVDPEGPRLNSPFPFQAAEGTAPEWGEHTRPILRSLGYTDETIEDLAGRKIVRLAEQAQDL